MKTLKQTLMPALSVKWRCIYLLAAAVESALRRVNKSGVRQTGDLDEAIKNAVDATDAIAILAAGESGLAIEITDLDTIAREAGIRRKHAKIA